MDGFEMNGLVAFIEYKYNQEWMKDQKAQPKVDVDYDIEMRGKIDKEVGRMIREMVEEVQFMVTSGPHQSYFLSEKDKQAKLKQVNQKYSSLVQNKLMKEIEVGVTKVSKAKTEFTILPKPTPTQQQKIVTDKTKILLKKRQAIDALNEVLRQESEIVRQKNSMLKDHLELSRSRATTHQNPEWKEHLAIALKRKKELQRTLDKKTQQVEQKVQRINEEEAREKRERLERMRMLSLKEAEEKRAREEQQRAKEQQFKKKCEEFVQRMKPAKYRFQIMSKRGEERLRMMEQQQKQRLKSYKEMRSKRDWQELRHHQQKYFETISERKEQWLRKFQTAFESRTMKKYNSSVFADRLKDAEEQRMQEQQERNERKMHFQEKIKHYSSSVLQHHRPKKFMKSLHLEENNSSIRESLNRAEEREKGLSYLTEAKKKHKSLREGQIKGASSLPVIKTPYKDYLKEQPKRTKEGTNSTKFYSALTEKKGEWVSSAKSILQKLDKTHKPGSKVMLDCAFKKIELLQAMM